MKIKTALTITGLIIISSLIGAELTPAQLMDKVDEAVSGPTDQYMKVDVILISESGKKSKRVMEMKQSGTEKRMIKFLEPADQKGIGVLILPGDITYLYLPAFKKIRRIASSAKNQKFAGTDYSYEDMETEKLSLRHNCKIEKQDERHYVILLTPKAEIKSEYSKKLMTIRKDNYYPIKVEYFGKNGEKIKEMTRDDIRQIGQYWAAYKSEMKDLRKNHISQMNSRVIKFNTGIPDTIFTKRELMK